MHAARQGRISGDLSSARDRRGIFASRLERHVSRLRTRCRARALASCEKKKKNYQCLIRVTTPTATWRELFLKERAPQSAFLSIHFVRNERLWDRPDSLRTAAAAVAGAIFFFFFYENITFFSRAGARARGGCKQRAIRKINKRFVLPARYLHFAQRLNAVRSAFAISQTQTDAAAKAPAVDPFCRSTVATFHRRQ